MLVADFDVEFFTVPQHVRLIGHHLAGTFDGVNASRSKTGKLGAIVILMGFAIFGMKKVAGHEADGAPSNILVH